MLKYILQTSSDGYGKVFNLQGLGSAGCLDDGNVRRAFGLLVVIRVN